MTSQCLNCASPVNDNFCEKCGQKASTHRFSLKHIFSHDFVHGVFHLDKGFFFTLKALLTRPGHSIREFIAGKRVRHFNYFTLILLLLTIDILLRELSPVKLSEVYESVAENKKAANFLDEISNNYPKLIALMAIPVYAFFSWRFFAKAKQNFAEHLVLNAYKAAGEILVGMGVSLAMVFIHDTSTLATIVAVFTVLFHLYSVIFYYQYFSVFNYSRIGLFFRSLICTLAFAFIVMIVTIVLVVAEQI